MNLRSGVLDLLRLAYSEEQAFISEIPDKERTVIGTYDQWSLKDVIGHIAAWKKRTAQELAAVTFGAPRPDGDNLDQINSWIFKKYRDLTWDEVLELSQIAYKALCDQVNSISEKNLTNTGAIKWYDGPIWRLAIDDGYSHPLSHLAECYERCGEEEQGIRIRKEADKSRAQFPSSVKEKHKP
jgi:hypothetical protein